MNLVLATAIDKLSATFSVSYPKFQEYAKISMLYIGAAGIMVQVIKSMRS